MEPEQLETVRMLNNVLRASGFLVVLLQIGIAVAAFVRFRATPAGLLVGGCSAVSALLGCVMRSASLASSMGEYDDARARAFMVAGAGQSCIESLLVIGVGVGLFLLAESFQRLAGGGAKPREP